MVNHFVLAESKNDAKLGDYRIGEISVFSFGHINVFVFNKTTLSRSKRACLSKCEMRNIILIFVAKPHI